MSLRYSPVIKQKPVQTLDSVQSYTIHKALIDEYIYENVVYLI